jgi:uncharacterized protein
MISSKNTLIVLAGIGMALIIGLSGIIAARGFSGQDSYIDVKGLSERIVKADIAVWTLNFEVKSNNIETLYLEITDAQERITAFLGEQGFEASEINIAPINMYQDTYVNAPFRFNSSNQISVYTGKVDLARSASNETLSLIRDGVVLTNTSIVFEFSDLNSIKFEMLDEAVSNAQTTAEQFGSSASVTIGSVIRGNQGVFEISEKDPGSPEYKKIRLVSTLRFLIQ